MIVGTKYLAILSARPWMGALAFYAFSTSFIIWLIEEFSAVFDTLTIMLPYSNVEPPNTFEPMSFAMGLASPVSMLSSQIALPKTTTPSMGTPLPG